MARSWSSGTGIAGRRMRQEIVTIAPVHGAGWRAIQVGTSVTVPLAVLVAMGRTDLASYAVFGAMGSVYGARMTRPARARAQSMMGAAMVVSVLLGVLASSPLAGRWGLLIALGASSSMGLLITWRTGWLPIPALFMVFSTGTVIASTDGWHDLPLAAMVATAAACLTVLIGQLVAVWQSAGELSPVLQLDREAAFGTAELGLLLPLYALAPPAAAAMAILLNLDHPYWAAVSATVPLAGITFTHQAARTAHRIGGTLVGVLLAYGILVASLPLWMLVVVVGLCQCLTELFVRRNYGIAVAFITPMALILSDLDRASAPFVLVVDRVLGTVIGVTVPFVLLLAFALWRLRRRAGQV